MTALSLVVLSALLQAQWVGDAVTPASEIPLDRAGSSAPPEPQDRSFGSSVPCAVPLEWRIGDVDSRFGLDESAARAAVREAAALWERAMDRELFQHEPTNGFPVRFEFDDRQALLQVRRRLQEELRHEGRSLDARREELATLGERMQAARAEFEQRLAAFEQRTVEHDAEIRRWNERGGAPDSVRARIQRRTAELREERRSLERQQRELRDLQERLRDEIGRLNERIRERNRRAQGLQREFPVTAMEAGRYGESVRRRGREAVSVDREIRVFRFEGMDDLVLLLAHELGHALGLGHSGVEGAVMSEVAGGGGDDPTTAELHPSDVAALRERCPGL